MRTLKPLGRRKLGLISGLVIALVALATLGLTGPLTTATAQAGTRVCGMFWYTQLPDSANDNKLTWFTLGATMKIDRANSNCVKNVDQRYPRPDVKYFRQVFPQIPASVEQAQSWVVTRIDKITCEDFASRIAKPPNGETILDRGQNWPYDAADPCLSWELEATNLFWFKHL